MNHNIRNYNNLVIIFLCIMLSGCSGNKNKDSRVVVGIPSDIENFNPMFAFSVNEGNISELLYLSLVKHEWNNEKSDINSYPMLAERWQWDEDSSSILFYLRKGVKWSDGKKVTAEDVAFSFDIYSDPLVESRLYGTFSCFFTDSLNHILSGKTFEILSPEIIKIHFKAGSNPSLFNLDLPVIPKHIFEKVDRKNINSAKELFMRVTDGPFYLKEWRQNQYIVLAKKTDSFLNNESTISELVFKIIPEYTSRLMQVKKGEIDLSEEIKSEDVEELKNNQNLVVATVSGREYDYIGWNNIDPASYEKNQRIIANKLFGNANVRKALTHAINRKDIVDEYLNGFAQLCDVPFSPIMKNIYNQDIKGYEYNPTKAKELLKQEGWKDTDNDNILEKNGEEFRFSLFIPGGNPRRAFAASLIKSNLKDVGIEVTIETRELNHLIDNLYSKKLDAWVVSLYIPFPPDLRICWHSDLQMAALNFASYRSNSVDKLIDNIEKTNSTVTKNKLYQQFQQVIHDDQPITFLYWIDNIVVYNKRIDQVKIDPLGVIQKCWNWSIRS